MLFYIILWVVLIVLLIGSNMKRNGSLDDFKNKMQGRQNDSDQGVVDEGESPYQSYQNVYSQNTQDSHRNFGGIQKQAGNIGRVAAVIIAVVLVVAIGMNCWYTLSEEEYAVVTTFGAPSVEEASGLHFKIPFIQKVTKVSKAIMGMEIGYTTDPNRAPGASENNPVSIDNESLMITRDYNLVNVDFYVEYMVTDPIEAVRYRTVYEDIIKSLAQSYIRDTVGVYDVDDVITTGKTEIQETIKEKLTNRLVEENIGYGIYNVSIQDTEMPRADVAEAFRAVEDAKQGMETNINSALKYQSENIPLANAEADRVLQAAEAYKQERINEATGQAARFLDTYEEYIKYPLITKNRMFYETLEDVLPDIKVIIDDGSGTQTILPLEPLSGSSSTGSSSAARSSSSGTGSGSASAGSSSASGSTGSGAAAASADTASGTSVAETAAAGSVTGGEQ